MVWAGGVTRPVGDGATQLGSHGRCLLLTGPRAPTPGRKMERRQHKIQDGPSRAWGWVIQAPCAIYPRRTHGFAQQHSPRYGQLLQPRGRKAKAVQLPTLHLHVYFMTTAIIFPPFPTKRWFEE